RLARQRAVNDILKDELGGRIHALAMRTLTPEEFSRERD
ncbi:MAG: BolA family protein, partial [Pseudomonadota bacterium]